ncbi:ATP-binding protein [Longimicrobium sp.]|uniref:ATP-binding protein n=1 Tax=Longimicrobium sp. TaxID=2029185 RepID=UPI002F950593
MADSHDSPSGTELDAAAPASVPFRAPERGASRVDDERLTEIFANAPALIAVLRGPDHVFELANPPYLRLLGGRDVVGRPVREAVPEVAEQGFLALLDGVYQSGEPFVAVEMPMQLRVISGAPPEERFFNFVYQPLRDGDGRVDGILGHGVDITDLVVARRIAEEQAAELEASADELKTAGARLAEEARERERTLDQARRLQRLTALLNQAVSPEAVADVILEGGLAATGADAASLAILRAEAGQFEIVRTAGYGKELADRYRTFPLEPGRPVSEAVLRREIMLVDSPEAWRERFPGAPEDLVRLGYQAFGAVPVASGERTIAVLSFSFRVPQEFDEATRTFLATLGEQCGLALERARLHAAELHNAERLASLLETIQDPFAAFDRELRFTYVNPQAEKLLGKTSAEVMGRRMDELFADAAQSPMYAGIHETVRTGERTEVEGFSPVIGRWVEARIYPAPDGVSLVFQDVTERRRREEAASLLAEASRALSASLDYATTLRAVAQAAVPALGDWCAVDILANPGAEGPPEMERVAIFHRDAAKLALAEEFTSLYPTDWSGEQGSAGVLKTGTPVMVPRITDEMLAAGARDAEHLAMLRLLQFSAFIIVPLVARGRTVGVLTLCMTESGRGYDEADLRVAEDLAHRAAIAVDNARLFRDAERARAEAEAANRAKSEFLAVMSHELRTPLNAIGGYTELLAMGIRGAVTPEQATDLERIRRSQQHLLGLINEVLNYAKLETGTVHYDVGDVDAPGAVAEVESLVLPQAQSRRHTLVAECDAGVVVRADPEKLRQILLNVVSNAVRFTPEGGRITIGARTGGDAVAEITVADTGIGIPEDKLEAIFEPFVQVGRGLNTPGEGTGLGLAISRDLARGMGGDLVARSTPGEGSVFTLTLPAGG